jgi:hypothetical protein
MNRSQLDHAEALLGVTLPDAYRQFMERLPDPGQTRGFKGVPYFEVALNLILINHPEGLAVVNRELRDKGPAFADKPWPDRYLAIGHDGCGNTYCLDVGKNPSPALLMFDHDPANDFVEADPSYAAVFASLEIPEPTADESKDGDESPDDEEAAPALIVARVSEPWQSILNPIRLDEWRAYIESDPSLKYIGYREGTNPFTGEAMRMNLPGYAVWEQAPGKTIPIEYRSGRLMMQGEHPHGLEAMKRIAHALSARLFDANGRELAVQ